MAETLPSPPRSSRNSSISSDHDSSDHNDSDLSTNLDNLLAQYLELLDTYTRLREDLSKSCSAGFFTLAQAQRASTLGAGRRYGQECYDQRMKSQRKVKVQKSNSNSNEINELSIVESDLVREDRLAVEKVQPLSDETTAITKSNSNDTKSVQVEADPLVSTKRAKVDPWVRDPLTWFGILAPPSLRITKSTFVGIVEQTIPALLNADMAMRRLEEQVWDLRRQLGIEAEYQSVHVNGTDEPETEESALVPSESHQPSRSNKQRLPQRPTHAKSHLLKLGD